MARRKNEEKTVFNINLMKDEKENGADCLIATMSPVTSGGRSEQVRSWKLAKQKVSTKFSEEEEREKDKKQTR